MPLKKRKPPGSLVRSLSCSEMSDEESAAASSASQNEPLSTDVAKLKCLSLSVPESPAPSVVSMKSSGSMDHPMSFNTKRGSPFSGPQSPAPSVVSMKSSGSMDHPMSFNTKRGSPFRGPQSPAPSVVSVKSSGSLDHPMSFNTKRRSPFRGPQSPAPSVVSVKSSGSLDHPMSFNTKRRSPFSGPQSPAPSVVSMKSSGSMDHPMSFNTKRRYPFSEPQSPAPQKAKRDPERHTATVDDPDFKPTTGFKEEMRQKCTLAPEGNGDQGTPLNTIYSELIISTRESEGPHEEHTLRHIKLKLSAEQIINLNDIFKPLYGQENLPRVILMKGIAGIGKSFSVQKFTLDWAEGRANQDVQFIFTLAFREVNLIKGNKSFHELLTDFHPQLRNLKDSEEYIKTKIVVILDGLDESRHQLDFENKPVSSVSEVTSVGNLLANLIQGNLLPDAKVWITSRPAAANQIPADLIDMVTEIRGFSDPQKEQYFRKRFSHNLSLAERIISHIHSSQSLNMMCQIPIFCWISAILFEEVFEGDERAEIPQTLTEMMAHFLLAQTKRRNWKYEKTDKNPKTLLKAHSKFLLKLGKLAFVNLQKNNLVFYEEDLEDLGIDIQEAIVYSGFCTAVFREEVLFSQGKVFFFVHLTIQEFFAALFVYDCFKNNNTKELRDFLELKDNKVFTVLDFLKLAVDKVLEKRNGHLDLFLRFLLGLMVDPNQRPLQGLLEPPDASQDTQKKILTYLKAIRRKALSPDSCISLFQTMVEMRDHKVKDEIQQYLRSSDGSTMELTPLHCSALAFMLQVSEYDLDVLDLKSYNTTEEGRRRLIPAVRNSRRAILADCNMSEEWVEHLAFGLKFPYSPLRDLDLSSNDLTDSGVKLLCDGLSSPHCRLERLRLSGCQVTEEGCARLASALKSNPSHLRELDLSYNNPGDSGVKVLSELRDDPQYNLATLKVEHGGSHRMRPGFKKYACELTWDPNKAHKNLLLSDGNRTVTLLEKKTSPRPGRPDDQQVLCEQGLDGCCYWEVEVLEPFSIGLRYRNVDNSTLGCDDKSWCLTCSNDGCSVRHGNQTVNVQSLCSRSSRVAFFLDWPGGTLSFYRVSSDTRNHLFTFRTSFSEPLYPAVELPALSSAAFCRLT